MSYNTVDYSNGEFKAFDYAALQAMYGVNQSARNGNDVYKFNNMVGTLVWDGGGVDKIDASGSSLNAFINLNQGSLSYLGEKSQYISSANQLSINLSTIIENATGSNLNDTLIGNQYDNILDGGQGDDLLKGGYGNDTLIGGLGADIMIGGLGDDTYYVDNIKDNVVEKSNEGTDRIYSSVSYDLYGRHVEELYLTGSDNINAKGNTLKNVLVGNAGNNILDGGAGDDILTGGLGSDTVIFNVLKAGDALAGNGKDTWLDFKLGNTLIDPDADVIDISKLLIDFNGDNTVDDLMSFISFTKKGNDSIMSIDRDGASHDFKSASLLTFKDVDVTLTELLNNHQLIV